MQKNALLSLACVLIILCTSGCLLTRVATMPMPVGGAVLTIIPIAGDAAHKSIDEAADVVDELPF